jgi:uncharacterized protein YegJ (DUF2314 family)
LIAPALGAAEDTDPIPVEKRVNPIRASDQEIGAARQQARDAIAEFKRRLAEPPASQTDISLKAAFTDGEHTEHMWLIDVETTARGFRGILVSTPVNLDHPKRGDTVEVTLEEVSDWYAIDDGWIVGGYTLRVMRSRKSPAEQAEYDEMIGGKFR